MSVVKQEERQFQYRKETVFDALFKTIPTVNGMNIVSADTQTFSAISVNSGVSLISWGEKIQIKLMQITPTTTSVNITSQSSMGTTLVDWGKNKKNITNIFTALMAYLQRVPPELK